MGFGELFSKSWQEYKKNFKLISKSYLWLYAIPLKPDSWTFTGLSCQKGGVI